MRMRISMFPLPESERSVDRNLQILIQYLSFSQKNNEHWHRLSIISFLCLRSHIHIRQLCQQSILTSQCHKMSHCKINFGSQICDFASLHRYSCTLMYCSSVYVRSSWFLCRRWIWPPACLNRICL